MKSIIITCTLLVSSLTGTLASPLNTKRELPSPAGHHDGHGPVCSIYDCGICPDFPGCGTDVERRALLAKRQLECPPGVHCGAGPVCTIHDCDLCPEFPGCNTEVERRAVLKRQIECPPGVHCGSGPVCTIDDCDLCPDFPSCDTKVEHRASTVAKRQLKSVNDIDSNFMEEKRDAEDDLWCFVDTNNKDICMYSPTLGNKKRADDRFCPVVCNEQGQCGCQIFDNDLQCYVAPSSVSTTLNSTEVCVITKRDADFIQQRDTTFHQPCPLICNEEGFCDCAGGTESSLDKTMKRDTTFNHPCPLICNEEGFCDCAGGTESSVDKTMKRDEDLRGPPCPYGNYICNKSGCKCGGHFITPVNPPK